MDPELLRDFHDAFSFMQDITADGPNTFTDVADQARAPCQTRPGRPAHALPGPYAWRVCYQGQACAPLPPPVLPAVRGDHPRGLCGGRFGSGV
jgi:hypothetical protein